MLEEIAKLEEKIAQYPKGCISTKNIGGKVRHYLQWSENGKTKSKYLSEDEHTVLAEAINDRRRYEKMLKELKAKQAKQPKAYMFENKVVINSELKRFIAGVANMKAREQLYEVIEYLTGFWFNEIFCVYGPRGSGKTVLLIQVLEQLSAQEQLQAAYILPPKNSPFANLEKDLQRLMANKYKYVIIDNIQNIKDFKECACQLTDYYIPAGMNIVVTGTGIDFMKELEQEELFLKVKSVIVPRLECF